MTKQLEKLEYTAEVKITIEDQELDYLSHILSKLEDEEYAAAERMAILSQETGSWLEKYQAKTEQLYGIMQQAGLSLDDAIGIMTGQYTQEQIDALGLAPEVVEALQGLGKDFMDISDSLSDIGEKLKDELLKTIDETIEKFDELGKEIDTTSKKLDHYKNIVDILGMDALGVSAEQMTELLQTSINTSLAALANNKNILTALQDERKKTYDALQKATGEEAEALQEALDKIDEEILNAEDSVRNGLESVLKQIVDVFKTNVQLAAQEFEKTLTGTFGSLDKLQEAFDRQKELDELYIDDYKKVYELSKLTRDITKSMDETNNIKGKQALRDLQQEINQLQKDGVKLSEYDVNMLRAKYDLRLAEIALEEAQNAKSQVRMTKDSEGNWSYTYTADENTIAQAEQDYEDKLYKMQELNQEYIKNLQSQMIAAQAAMSKALQNIDPNAGPEEVAAITEHYQQIFDSYSQQMQNAFGDSEFALESMSERGMEETEGWVNSFDETTLSALTGYESLQSYQEAFATSTQSLVEKLNGVFENYSDNIQLVTEASGQSFEDFGDQLHKILFGEDGNGGINKDVEDLGDASEKLVKDTETNVSDALSALTQHYEEYAEQVALATAETWGLEEAIKALLEAKPDDEPEPDPEPEPEPDPQPQDPPKPSLKKGSRISVKSGTKWYSDSYGGGPSGKARGGTIAYINEAGTHAYNIDGLGWVKKTDIVGYNTGGYTGAWGSSGKLAMLHEKELVLNSDDTRNMLAIIEAVRDITRTIDLNANGNILGLGGLMASMIPSSSSELNQNVEIHAEFPNATNRGEIEAAFDNLINRASQYANRK